jgi:hypothetical protein
MLTCWIQITLAGSEFDTLLAVYTGAAVNALTRVASNDNCNTGEVTSCIAFSVQEGMVYSVQVDGINGAKGILNIADLKFTWAAPSNDAFSAAVTAFPATGTTRGATLQTGEPRPGTGASGSVWHRFTAVSNGSVQVRLRKYYCRHTEGVCVQRCAATNLPTAWPVHRCFYR